MTKKQQIEEYIETSFLTIKNAIPYSEKYNTGITFDTGTFGEVLTCIIFDCYGSGTQGGASFDTSRGDEVKTLFFASQAKECNKCGFKCSFFMKSCVKCESSDFTYKKDTRAGIDSKTHFRYYSELNNYVIYAIEPESYHFDCRKFTIKGYLIKKDNKFFNEMLQIQKEYSAGHKNLLITSIEFDMSCPSLFLKASVTIEEIVKCEIQNISYTYEEQHVAQISKNKFKRNYKKYLPFINEERYNPIKNIINVEPAKGTHGKKRGTVRRKNLLPTDTNRSEEYVQQSL